MMFALRVENLLAYAAVCAFGLWMDAPAVAILVGMSASFLVAFARGCFIDRYEIVRRVEERE